MAATVVAAGIAYGTSVLAFVRLAPAGTAIPQLGRDYYDADGHRARVAFGVIAVTLPLLRRMTTPATSASNSVSRGEDDKLVIPAAAARRRAAAYAAGYA